MISNALFRLKTSVEKGVFAESTEHLKEGQVILQEESIFFGSFWPELCMICCQMHSFETCSEAKILFNESQILKLQGLINSVADIDFVQDIDKAEIMVLALAILTIDKANRVAQEQFSKQIDFLTHSLPNYSRHKIKEAQEAIHDFLKHIKDLNFIGNSFNTTDSVLISTLTNFISSVQVNCHSIGQIDGLAFFPTACRFEHSCTPNCNFSTVWDASCSSPIITITAIKQIMPGESLSVDYIESFYTPKAERKAILLEEYGFICKCSRCLDSSADNCRVFACQSCSHEKSIVCPPQWTCSTCHIVCTQEQIKDFLAAEQSLQSGTLQNLDQLISVVQDKKLRIQHFLCYETLKNLAAEEVETLEESQCTEIILLYEMLLSCLDFVCPDLKYPKLLVYDTLGQVHVILDQQKEAIACFKKALHLSMACIGPESTCLETRRIKQLVRNPPKTIEDLYTSYK